MALENKEMQEQQIDPGSREWGGEIIGHSVIPAIFSEVSEENPTTVGGPVRKLDKAPGKEIPGTPIRVPTASSRE